MADSLTKVEPGLERFANPTVNTSGSVMSDTVIKFEPGLGERAVRISDVPEFAMEDASPATEEFSTIDLDNNPEHLRLTCLVMVKLIRHLDVNFKKRTLAELAENLGVPIRIVK